MKSNIKFNDDCSRQDVSDSNYMKKKIIKDKKLKDDEYEKNIKNTNKKT